MTILEAIQVRHSVRQYKDTAIEAEKIAQQQQAIDEERQDDSCFLEYQPEGQFVRGH